MKITFLTAVLPCGREVEATVIQGSTGTHLSYSSKDNQGIQMTFVTPECETRIYGLSNGDRLFLEEKDVISTN